MTLNIDDELARIASPYQPDIDRLEKQISALQKQLYALEETVKSLQRDFLVANAHTNLVLDAIRAGLEVSIVKYPDSDRQLVIGQYWEYSHYDEDQPLFRQFDMLEDYDLIEEQDSGAYDTAYTLAPDMQNAPFPYAVELYPAGYEFTARHNGKPVYLGEDGRVYLANDVTAFGTVALLWTVKRGDKVIVRRGKE